MVHTDLLKEILKRADAIKSECGAEYLYASHVVIAVTEFCKTKYTGFPFSTYHYPRFEDERLRYLAAMGVGLPPYLKMCLRQNAQAQVREKKFDVDRCEEIAALRGAKILSADVVFLCALRDLHPFYKFAVRRIDTDASILAFLQDADANIYDYVIKNIEEICTELREKADEAAAIRDRKPASKFAGPEELATLCSPGEKA